MGFMTAAGAFSESFGKAFSTTYANTQDIKAKREAAEKEQENDIFKLTLKEQMDNKEELRKQKAKEAGITATAQSIAEATGGPPSEIAKRLLAGADTSAVTDWAKSQDWKKTSSADLGMVSPPTSAANANNSGRNVNGRLPGIDSDAGVAAAQGATEQQMQDVFPTSPVTRTDPSTFEAMPTDTPAIPEAPVQQPMGQTYDGLVGTPKAKTVPFNQTVDQAKAAVVTAQRNNDPEAIRSAEANLDSVLKIDNAGRRPAGQTNVDLQRDIADAIKNGDTEEATRLQGVSEAIASGEQQAKIVGLGSQRGVFLDASGNRKVGIIKPIQTENGVGWVTLDEQGQSIPATGARPLVDGEQEALTKFAGEVTGAKAQDLNTKVTSLGAAYRSAGRIDQILEKHPNVRANAIGFVSKTVADISNEIDAAADLLGVEAQKNGEGGYTAEGIDALDRAIKGINLEDIKDDDRARSILNAEMGILLYHAGAATGQSGAAFGKNDQAVISQIIGADASKGQTMQQILANYLDGSKRNIDDQVGTFNRGVTSNFRNQGFDYVPMDMPVENFDRYSQTLQGDQDFERGRTLSATKSSVDSSDPNANKQAPVAQSGLTRTFKGSTYRLKGGNPNDKNNWEKVE